MRRGEIRLYEFKPPDKRRPVLVLTRPEVIDLLRTVMVAPITSAIRGSPGEVTLGVDQGLKGPSAVNLDHVQTVEQRRLGHYVGSLSPEMMARVCEALMVATGCEP
ncbi:MAG: type II toxin-antitoxin system PemK/MazF family toxin [Deltaproteobacteria bacterium]|nr:type II toxin-antitoxin system PemK/MazF family toxin [Deltaproteobacteria bacterium]